MFSWLFAIPFIGSFIQIITPAIKGIVEGIVAWLSACWHGIKTSNYGTWTLILTTAALVWSLTPCPGCPAPKGKASISRGVETAPKDSNSVKDITCHWLGC